MGEHEVESEPGYGWEEGTAEINADGSVLSPLMGISLA